MTTKHRKKKRRENHKRSVKNRRINKAVQRGRDAIPPMMDGFGGIFGGIIGRTELMMEPKLLKLERLPTSKTIDINWERPI